VRRHGQAWFARLAADAGADGIEVRGELLVGGDRELAAIADAAGPLQRVYSSADGLWRADGTLDADALDRAAAAATRLGAPRMKMSIGGWSNASTASFDTLRDRLTTADVELVIENDQTPTAGTLTALERFFTDAAGQGLGLGMTFDIGNWHWQGECPLHAAASLAAHVR